MDATMARKTLTKRDLVSVILELDTHLPHQSPRSEDAPRPQWCRIFADYFGVKGKDCCGVCSELSETTLAVLDKLVTDKSHGEQQ